MDDYDEVSPPWESRKDEVKSVLIQKGVTTIGNYAFSDCKNLTGVYYGEDITSIGKCAFSGCEKMSKFLISNKVTSIGCSAFERCTSLTEIKLPESITKIEKETFSGCSGLITAFFSEKIQSVDDGAFENCNALKDVFFGGTEEQWDAILIGGKNECLINANIHINSVNEPLKKTGMFSYSSMFSEQTEQYNYEYDESWFKRGATSGYQHDLARMSLRMAMAAYGVGESSAETNIEQLLDDLNFKSRSIDYPFPTEDSVGYAIGSKKFREPGEDEDTTLVAVVVRSGGYRYEWSSNFKVGIGATHQGFAEAEDHVYNALMKHFIDNKIEQSSNVKIWISGYSRGAATANLLAARLDKEIIYGGLKLKKDNVYAYCFECPLTTKESVYPSDIYSNIHNVVNEVDFVTKVAPMQWKYQRFGITHYLPSEENDSKNFTSAYLRMEAVYSQILKQTSVSYTDDMAIQKTATINGQGAFLDEFLGQLASYMISSTVYAATYQNEMRRIGKLMGENEGQIGQGIRLFLKNIPEVVALEPFGLLHSSNLGKAIGAAEYLGSAHYAELCLAWMDSLSGSQLKESSLSYRYRINCPVDVQVYNSAGTLVVNIVADEVRDTGSTIGAYIDENGQKVVILPTDDVFDIRYNVTDNGTMSCQIETHDAEQGTIHVQNFFNIPITKNEVLSATSADRPTIHREDGGEVIISEDLSGSEIVTYSIELSSDSGGTVSGGGSFIPGEYAQITAKGNDGYQFLGWYEGETLVSQSEVYRFCVQKNQSLVAKFAAVETHEGICGQDLTWKLQNGTLTISGTGDMIDYLSYLEDSDHAPWAPYREQITKVVIEPGVWTVGNSAFYGCTNLTEAVLPESLYKIGQYAFAECTSLQRIELPKNLNSVFPYAFWACDSMEEVWALSDYLWNVLSHSIGYAKDNTILPDLCIHGYRGSDVYFYAQKKGIRFVSEGGYTLSYFSAGIAGVDAGVFTTNNNQSEQIGTIQQGQEVRTFLYTVRDDAIWGRIMGLKKTSGEITFGAYTAEELNNPANEPISGWVRLDAMCPGGMLNENLTWSLDAERNLTVSGQGDIISYQFIYTPTLRKLYIGEGVTSIDGNTFSNGRHITEIHFDGAAPSIDPGAFTNVTATVYYKISESGWDTAANKNYGGTLTWVGLKDDGTEQRYRLHTEFESGTAVEIDGVPFSVDDNGDIYLPNGNARAMTVFTIHEGDPDDVHTQYPVGMKVWMLSCENYEYTAENVAEFENILQYSGSSIRITGNKGIRMITSIEQSKKSALVGGGLAGYKLLEYGTLLAQTSKLGSNPLILGGENVKSNYAYKRGVADPVFNRTGSLMQYTNVLVGFNDEQCAEDIAMRPYMIVEDAAGIQYTLYGGIIFRSIGYIAYQNRNVFTVGGAAYAYVWNIIHAVYADQYDSEYRK